jgi:hypothetical protein
MPLRAGYTCPKCGARKKRLKYALATLSAIEALVIAVHMEFPAGHGPRMLSDASAAPAPLMRVLDDAKPPAGWFYYETRDPMINDVTRHARVISRGIATGFNMPSHGTTGVLELRRSAVYGNSVLITLNGPSFDLLSTHVTIRAIFDGGEIRMFDAVAGEGERNATLVVDDAHGFVGNLAAAQSLSVDVVLNNSTERVASFPVGGLKWD